MPLGVEIGLDDVANEIAPRLLLRHRFCCHIVISCSASRGPAFCQIRRQYAKAGFRQMYDVLLCYRARIIAAPPFHCCLT